MARRYGSQELNKAYKINEGKKKRQYNERILEVEHVSFTPLVMSDKERYSVIKNWISRKIPFALVNCVCMCVRGSRSIYPLKEIDLENDPGTS